MTKEELEKEAEQYIKEHTFFDEEFGLTSLDVTSKTAFQDGAEFGYNKANEWHYVKDKLPPEDVPLLCVRGGKIYVAWYYNSIYHDSRCCQVKKPYAWKEIVLPELKESE